MSKWYLGSEVIKKSIEKHCSKVIGYAFLFTFQGTAWIGVVDDGHVVTTYNVTAGQVIFFPKNTLHWIKNVGNEDCFFLLFFSTHDELQTLDVDDVFFSTPEDIASRSLKVCTEN